MISRDHLQSLKLYSEIPKEVMLYQPRLSLGHFTVWPLWYNLKGFSGVEGRDACPIKHTQITLLLIYLYALIPPEEVPPRSLVASCSDPKV